MLRIQVKSRLSKERFVWDQTNLPGINMEIKAPYAPFVRFVVIKILCVYPGEAAAM
jgi:hypothetical protein